MAIYLTPFIRKKLKMKITKEKFTDITETSLDGNTYEACDFSDLRVDYGVLSKVKFIDCNFSNANFTDCGLHDCHFKNCNLIGTSLINCTLKNVRILSCLGSYLNIGSSILEKTQFTDSNVKEMRLINNRLRNTTFNACNMSKLTLSDTRLRGVDLSTCDISGMIFKPFDVVGCQVSANQAVEMIKNFGVIVKF